MTADLRLRALALPVLSQGFATLLYVRALVNIVFRHRLHGAILNNQA